MRSQVSTYVMIVALAAVVLAGPGAAQADPIVVSAGWDVFVTQDGTEFQDVDFEGVPLGTFDFGGTIGSKATGDADTIVKRVDEASVTGDGLSDTIDIKIVALQLVSTGPVDMGAGVALYYITLQISTASTGTMTIDFANQNGGTFSSSFTVNFDLRFGALDGTILISDSKTMTSSNNDSGRLSPSGAIEIEDVNLSTTAEEFWPPNTVTHIDPSGGTHVVQVPEPASAMLLAVGAYLHLLRRRR